MTLKEEQFEAFVALTEGKNVFLSGEAGTGKSYVIGRFIEYLEANNIKYVVGAPTGLAALNIGGVTLHRLFGLSTDLLDDKTTTRNIEEAEVIIIDEISMCRKDNFQKIARTIKSIEDPRNEFANKKVVRNKQVVIVGDFYQLPPILGKEEAAAIKDLKKIEEYREKYKDIIDLESKLYPFQCKEWKMFNFKSIVLDEVVRQSDKEYIDNLNKIRRGDLEGLEFIKNNSSKTKIKKAIYLCSSNKKVNELNNKNLNKIKQVEYTYIADEDGDVKPGDRATSKELKLKKNARVMCIINVGDDIANGMMGTVIYLTKDSVTVQFDNGMKHEFTKHRWGIKGFEKIKLANGKEKVISKEIGYFEQIPLKLAWAVTIHKSQGQTYEAVNFDPSNCFAEGQLYVALSRAKDLKKLHMTKELKDEHLKSSKVVEDFYNELKNQEQGIEQIQEFEVIEDIEEDDFFDYDIPATTEENKYVSIQVPKTLEKAVLSLLNGEVLSLLNGEFDSMVNDEEASTLKRRIKDLEEEIERLRLSSKRRPKVSKEIEQEVIRLRKEEKLSMGKIAKIVKIGNGTVKRICDENSYLFI